MEGLMTAPFRFRTSTIALLIGFALLIVSPCNLGYGFQPRSSKNVGRTASAVQKLGSIDGVLATFYASLSFPEGGMPNWDLFRNLFYSPTSPCIRIAGDSVMTMDREGFITFFGGRIKRGTLKSFHEKEIGRTGEYYGSLAQVLSTYEKRMNLAEDGKPIRGINSFQFFFKNDRWWIASVVWQDESSEKPIPGKYTK